MHRKLSRRSFLRHSLMAGAGFAAAYSGIDIIRGRYHTTVRAKNARFADAELTLMMVDYSDPVKEALEEVIIPAFVAENPGTTVTVNYSSWDRYNEEMTTAFAAGVTPDIFQGGAVWTPQMARRNWALSLNEFIEGDNDWDWDDFPAGLQADVTIDDKILGVPYRQDLRTLWYRQDMLSEAGFDAPPTTWDEFLEVAIATTQRDGDGFAVEGYHLSELAGGWQRDWQPFLIWLEQAGAGFLNEDFTASTLNSDESVEALQFIYDLVHTHEVMSYPGLDRQGDLNVIHAGQAAMELGNADVERRINLYAPDEAENIFPALPLEGNMQATHAWVNKFFLSSQSKQPEQAWGLLRHLTKKDMLEVYSAANVNTPPRLSLMEADYMSEKHKTVLACAEYAQTFPQYPRLIETFRPIAAELEQCLSGNKTPSQAMEDAAKGVDEVLADE